MGLGKGELQIGAWEAGATTKAKGKKSKAVVKRVEDEQQPGCWIRFPLVGNCISSRSKVDSSISSASTRCGEDNCLLVICRFNC